MVTLTLEIPDEAEQIADLRENLSWFVREQIKLDQWRKRRFSGETDDLIEGAYQEAEHLRLAGMSPEQALKEFVQQWRELSK